jgi:hypothetical protein
MVGTGMTARTSRNVNCAALGAAVRTKEERPTPLSWSRGGRQGLAQGRKPEAHTSKGKIGRKETRTIPNHKSNLPHSVSVSTTPTVAHSQCVSRFAPHAIQGDGGAWRKLYAATPGVNQGTRGK